MNYINVKLKSPDPRDEIQNEIIDDDGSYYRATYYTQPTTRLHADINSSSVLSLRLTI